MKTIAVALSFVVVFAGVFAEAQKEKKYKPWTQWTRKDAERILGDSPWGRTRLVNDAAELFSDPSGRGGGRGGGGGRSRVNAEDVAPPLSIRIFWVSAKPVRQAWVKKIESLRNPTPEFKAQLLKFAETKPDDIISIGVSFDSSDRAAPQIAQRMMDRLSTEMIRETTFLELKGGKRLPLAEYRKPGSDLLGARFLFPRTVDGKPFLTPESGEVRFHAELSQNLSLNFTFKVAGFYYEGVFEY